MNAKQYLRRVKRLNDLIKAKFKQIRVLRDISVQITTDLSKDKIQTPNSNDKISQLVAKIVDLEKELTSDINRLINLQREVTNKINSLDDPEYRLILTMRYLNFETWEQIAVDLGCSYQWAHVLHARALREFEKVM
jgi:DNA-directed RNA polymerase specialized sigma24 family protein